MGWFVYINLTAAYGGTLICGPLSRKLSEGTINYHKGDGSVIESIVQKWRLFPPKDYLRATSEYEIGKRLRELRRQIKEE